MSRIAAPRRRFTAASFFFRSLCDYTQRPATRLPPRLSTSSPPLCCFVFAISECPRARSKSTSSGAVAPGGYVCYNVG